jgi:hypothetical protein
VSCGTGKSASRRRGRRRGDGSSRAPAVDSSETASTVRDPHPHVGCGADQRRLLCSLRLQGGPRRHHSRRPLRAQRASFSALAPGHAGVEQYAWAPYGPASRHPDGCPPPPCSTKSDAAPTQPSTPYTDGVLVIVDDIAARLAPRRSAFRLSVARGTASHNHGADGDVTSLQLRRQIILGYAQDGCKGRFSPVIPRRTDA